MRFDVAVIGAGPAGLAAASTAAAHGRSVVLLDAAAAPGGQFWRHRPGDPAFAWMRERLSAVDYRPHSEVWFVEPGFTVRHRGGQVSAARLVIATGAYDRVVPFPGWELPGVVTAGAAQALLKGQGVAVGKRVVVAGTGPFLLPVAASLAGAGIKIAGVFEAASLRGYARGLPPLGKLGEAVGYLAALARSKVRYRTGRVVIAAHGEERLTAVSVAHRGRTTKIDCDALAVGYGFTPQVELAIAAGCVTAIDADGSLTVAVDNGQTTSVPGVYAAGEVTGVGGAQLATIEGELAGLAACGLTAPVKLIRRREALRRFARLIAQVHRVPPWLARCADDTLVCRCEKVTAGRLRGSVGDLGVVDGRGAKLMTRAGMGWCQGRVCGYAASQMVATAHGRAVSAADLLAYATRPIARPVTLAELAEE